MESSYEGPFFAACQVGRWGVVVALLCHAPTVAQRGHGGHGCGRWFGALPVTHPESPRRASAGSVPYRRRRESRGCGGSLWLTRSSSRRAGAPRRAAWDAQSARGSRSSGSRLRAASGAGQPRSTSPVSACRSIPGWRYNASASAGRSQSDEAAREPAVYLGRFIPGPTLLSGSKVRRLISAARRGALRRHFGPRCWRSRVPRHRPLNERRPTGYARAGNWSVPVRSWGTSPGD